MSLPLLGRRREAIAVAFKATLGLLKLAVVDHIASFPPATFPVAAICAACRASRRQGCALHA